jgi:hypothetical protein
MGRIGTQPFQWDDSFNDTNKQFMRRIQESAVRERLKRMKGGKVAGLMVSQLRQGDTLGTYLSYG